MRAARHPRLAGLVTAWTLGLAACGSQPPAPTAAPGAAPRPIAAAPAPNRGEDGIDAFERQHRERAETAQRQGRLADAALSWEVLTALKPKNTEYRDRLAATRTQIQAAQEDRLAKGAAAHKRGELDGALQHYLAALALDPTHDAAADALRAIERERQKRHAGRLARDPIQRRANAEMDPRAPAATPAPAPAPVPARAAPARPGGGADKAVTDKAVADKPAPKAGAKATRDPKDAKPATAAPASR